MSGPAPTRTPLGASTNNRKWWLDVYAPADTAFANPIGVFGLKEFKPKTSESRQQDNSDWEGEGWGSSVTTGLSFGAEGKLQRKSQSSDPLSYDTGQEILRTAARSMGSAGRVRARIYEMEPGGPRVEAYEAWVVPTWEEDGGDQEALDTVSFNLMGQGKPTIITHPDGVVGAPYITEDVLPANTAVGGTIVIRGARFTGVTGGAGVKIGGTNATSYAVLDDDTITAVVPAGAAGSAPVRVTHPTTGASNDRPYNRGA